MRHKEWFFSGILIFMLTLGLVAERTVSHAQQAAPDTTELSAVEADDDQPYVEPNFRNLSQAYWKLGIHKLNDYGAIDKYMMIHECQIYDDFFKSDIDWAHIRGLARDQIKKELSGFPQKFRYLTELKLGRYNTQQELFYFYNEKPEITHSLFHGVNRVDLDQNSIYEDICKWQGRIPGYPRNILIVLSFPISLPYLEVPRDKASEYLRLKNTQNFGKRDAYLKLDITLKRYKDFIPNAGNGSSRYVIWGDLDHMGVYADREMTWPLYEVNYKRNRKIEE